QPRWVHTPSITMISGFCERYSFSAYFGCSEAFDAGSVSRGATAFKDSSISLVRRITQTGLPRHSMTASSPGAIFEMSASTGAPAARARSDGHMLATNGTAAPTPAMPPATEPATTRLRRVLSTFISSFMEMALLLRSPEQAQKRAILAMGLAKVHVFASKRLDFQENFVYSSSAEMHRLWLIFAQAATIAVAALFVVSTFRPEWLPSRPGSQVALVQQAPTTGPLPTAAHLGSYHQAVQRAAPSVVNIFTSKEIRSPRHPLLNDPIFRRFFGDQLPDEAQRASSLGSGVIVSAAGFVLTNHHVVEAADEIEVALADGKKLLAKVVGNDPETDLAVLRVNAENLPAITFGSSDALKVGDVVLAIGNPFGVGQTVTAGIVSALGRTGLGINTFENFIQTDA